MIKAMCSGKVVSSSELVDTLYGSRRDGGPTDASREVRKHVYRIRQKLSEVGVEVESVGTKKYSQGWRLAPDHIDRVTKFLGT
jgi:DNA-binding response OmpR family regulator